MKLSELKTCANCSGPVGQMFYVVRSSLALINPAAGNQVLGLTQMFGGSLALAEAMAPDDSPVKIAGDEEPDLWSEFLLCMDCHNANGVNIGLCSQNPEERP